MDYLYWRELNTQVIDKDWIEVKLASILELQDKCDKDMDKGIWCLYFQLYLIKSESLYTNKVML